MATSRSRRAEEREADAAGEGEGVGTGQRRSHREIYDSARLIDRRSRNHARTRGGTRGTMFGNRTAMRITTILSFGLSLLFCLVIAGDSAQAGRWHSRGWTKLGERSVTGRVDRDTIYVGRYEGKFRRLALVVDDSDLELLEFEVHFANGERYNPRMRHYFREGTRSREIDLPGRFRQIKKIELRYRNLAGGGNARIEVWGR
jgi:hypothetical protein